MAASSDKSTITIISLHVAPPGMSQAAYLAEYEKLAEAMLSLPSSRGIQRWDIFSPNQDSQLVEAVNNLPVDQPPVCIVDVTLLDSETSVSELMADPEATKLILGGRSFGFNHQSSVSYASTTTYIDKAKLGSSHALAVFRLPASSHNSVAENLSAAVAFHEELKPLLQAFHSIPIVQDLLTKQVFLDSNKAVPEAIPALDYTAPQGMLVCLYEVEKIIDLVELATHPAIVQVADKMRLGSLPAFECWAFGADCITKRGSGST